MDYSRRAMLGAMGGLVVGGSLAAMSGNVIAAPAAPAMSAGKDGHFGQMGGEFGWTPKKIDDIAAASAVAYKGYWYKGYGCGYGVFYSIIGTMAEKYIIMMQILNTKKEQDLDVATKVSIQLQLTEPDLKSRDRVIKKSEKDSLYAAMDIASVWLDRALAGKL